MMIGSCAGGSVHLAPAGAKLAIGEGIETCMSVLEATEIPTWSALSTSGMCSLVLPTGVREVVLLADGDPAGERAALDAASRFLGEGRCVRIARPPTGHDFNDMLQAL
jgi:hypothetical protein